MILNLGSIEFNALVVTGGNTPSWGTELGQGADYKFNEASGLELYQAMVYNAIENSRSHVYCPLGKGGKKQDDYEYVIASHFKKIFVNGKAVPNAEYVLLIVKLVNGDFHVGRRTLKYGPNITLDKNPVNENCFSKIREVLGLSKNATWFINEIRFINQDELHFFAYILNSEKTLNYTTVEERKRAFIKAIEIDPETRKRKIRENHLVEKGSLQQIFYGAPGTGKSHQIKEQTEGKQVVRTTFHPDSDYSTFVGAYKPTTKDIEVRDVTGKVIYERGNAVTENKIVYRFVPQAFLKAYTAAWKKQDEPYFLIIEEINRGNCAQIFGDLFQLLDRNEAGESEYPVSPDDDIRKFLQTDKKHGFASLTEEQMAAIPEKVRSGEELILPRNLYIWATMNTSDQSLFPIDSAFKRRWDWQYIPISDGKKDWEVEANGKRYNWWEFLQKINDKIGSTTNSEDKKLGYFFCKAKNGIIDAETFVGKVIFYVWNDVFKDFAEEAGDLFRDEDNTLLSFNKFYAVGDGGKTEVLEDRVTLFMQKLGVEPVEGADFDEDDEEIGRIINKSSFVSIQIPNNPKIVATEKPTQFDTFVEALKIIGIDKIIPIIDQLKYQRLNSPVISTTKYPGIENDKKYSYHQEGGLYIVKGCKPYTYVRILEDLDRILNIGLSIETK